MQALLQLMISYTASCPTACSSLAGSSSASTSLRAPAALKYQPNTASLLSTVIKLAQRESSLALTDKSPPLGKLKTAFALLTNLALSQECRGVFWKSNFLADFAQYCYPGKTKKSRAVRVLEGLWLDLLQNLSFSTDGHSMILKVQESVAGIIELGSSSCEQHQQRATLILRNMCTHAPNKAKLLANASVLGYLCGQVKSGSDNVQGMATSALLALLYNSQKAKMELKQPSIVRDLKDAYENIVQLKPASPMQHRSKQNLHSIMILLRT